jgi:hypothetical protein
MRLMVLLILEIGLFDFGFCEKRIQSYKYIISLPNFEPKTFIRTKNKEN